MSRRPHLVPALLALCLAGCAAQPRTQVHVVGTLYRRHDQVKLFDLAALRRLLTAIDPDVLVLDVTPAELASRRVSPGKVEYPGAVFPFLRPGRHRVYAAEPAEPTFSQIVNAVAAAHRRFESERPAAAAALEQLTEATYAALQHHWRSPAEVQGEVTGRVLAGKRAIEASLVGPARADGQDRWDRHMAGVVLRAAGENRGKRILVLVGIENRQEVVRLLAAEPELELVDMEGWLRGQGSR